MQRSKPESYTPPYPAFQQHQEAQRPDVVLAMIGLQSRDDADTTALSTVVEAALDREGPGQPAHVERVWHTDAQGYRNDVYLPYWHQAGDMAAFFDRGDVGNLLRSALSEGTGLWAERLAAPTTSLDANNARADARYGISRYSEPAEEQYHAYMGSMRDRVPDFLAGKADAPAIKLNAIEGRQTYGQVIEITDLPHNLCFIRGAFAWQDAGPEEQRAFQDRMMPVYREGAQYLRDNPIESGCISMRMADTVVHDDNNGLQSEILGWFLTLGELERWTRHHPRHLAIMKTILSYMEDFQFKPKLHMGHEVIVVPGGQAQMIYNNCHPKTGFLPFFR